MSVSTYTAGDLFTLRVIKSHLNNPDNKWANSYEFRAVVGGSEDELLELGIAVVMFEQALHQIAINFDRLLISTWAPDSKPYNPESFISSTLTGVGQAVTSSDGIGLHNTLSVTRQCAFGKFGHLFYRGCLEETQVSAPAGKSILTSKATIQGQIEAALTASNLDGYIGLTPTAPFGLVMVGASSGTARAVMSLRAQGVSAVPMDHAWFNRTTTP